MELEYLFVPFVVLWSRRSVSDSLPSEVSLFRNLIFVSLLSTCSVDLIMTCLLQVIGTNLSFVELMVQGSHIDNRMDNIPFNIHSCESTSERAS